MSDRWIVLGEGERRRWGGDLRRAFIFADLAARTGAELPRAHRPIRRWWDRRRATVASADLLTEEAIDLAAGWCRLLALDVHDDPAAQLEAFGIDVDPAEVARIRQRVRRNVDAFELLVAPSERFADLAGLPPERRILASNGTDTTHVRPGPWPARPTIGMVSGAAAGRGVEALIDAADLVRREVPDVRLALWLVAGGPSGEAYLDTLRRRLADRPWIDLGTAPYDVLGDRLATATVLCVPHPPGDYMDSALPVKLFDSMAAGRPLVVTPRAEMAAVVRRTESGLVAAGDATEELAAAIGRLLGDADLAGRLGANGRRAAEAEFDWRVIGRRVSDTVLASVGR